MAKIRTRVTRNGQITIPKEIRERRGIEEGDTIECLDTPEGILLRVYDQEPLDAEDVRDVQDALDDLRRSGLKEFVEWKAGQYGGNE